MFVLLYFLQALYIVDAQKMFGGSLIILLSFIVLFAFQSSFTYSLLKVRIKEFSKKKNNSFNFFDFFGNTLPGHCREIKKYKVKRKRN